VSPVSRVIPAAVPSEHEPENAMGDREEIARFYDRGSDLMRELLEALAPRLSIGERSRRSRTSLLATAADR